MNEWRPFDVIRGYDVKQVDESHWLLRDAAGCEWELDEEEFDLLRSRGDNPKDIA